MTTANTIIADALGLIGVVDSVENVQAEDANLGLRVLNRVIKSLGVTAGMSFVKAFQQFTLPAGTQSRTVGTVGDWVIERPARILPGAYVVADSISVPLVPLTMQDWGEIADKGATAAYPAGYLYVAASADLGTLMFWPIPERNVTVSLPVETRMSQFADLTTDYSLPDAYESFLVHELAIRLAPHYGTGVAPDVKDEAARSKKAIQRLNREIPSLRTDELRGLQYYSWDIE